VDLATRRLHGRVGRLGRRAAGGLYAGMPVGPRLPRKSPRKLRAGCKGRTQSLQWWVVLRQRWEEPAEALTKSGQNCLHRPPLCFRLRRYSRRAIPHHQYLIYGGNK
jgi:hypothetical protein